MQPKIENAIGYWVAMVWDNELFHYGLDSDTINPFKTFGDALDFGEDIRKQHKGSRVYIEGVFANGQLVKTELV
jgi:hypothetical protein